MNRTQHAATILYAVGMISLGILGTIYGDFALQWQPVPQAVAGRQVLAYAAAIIMLVGGVGLLFKRTAPLSARVLFPYMVLWLLLAVPGIIAAPLMEDSWLSFGEIAVLASGAWVLLAQATMSPARSKLKFMTGDIGIRTAQLFFGIWLIPIGLSHFAYHDQTVSLVPSWLPFRSGWAYLTGSGHIAAGIGVLFSILPFLAARLEAAMLATITALVWLPAVATQPTVRLKWTALIISLAITAGAWVVAESIPKPNAGAR